MQPINSEFHPNETKPSPSSGKLIDSGDWKIFKNEELGFEINYPSSWAVFEKELPSQNKKIVFYTDVESGKTSAMSVIPYYLEFLNFNDKEGKGILEYLKKSWEERFWEEIKVSEIRIGPYQIFKTDFGFGEFSTLIYYVRKTAPNEYLMIEISPNPEEGGETGDSIIQDFNKIVLSLRFL